MNTFMMLVKREYWENRAGFLYIPLVITGLCTFFVILGLFSFGGTSLPIMPFDVDGNDRAGGINTVEMLNNIVNIDDVPLEQKETFLNVVFTGLSVQFVTVLAIMLVMYFSNCLYQDRKDRSILFWKSMPISDTYTVASKFVAGLIVAPLIYFVCMMLTHIIVLVCLSFFLMGESVEIWASLWAPANLFSHWIEFLLTLAKVLVLYLPLVSWLVLVSAGAKATPLAWIVGVPFVLVVFENILTGGDIISGFVARAVVPFDTTVNAANTIPTIGYGIGLAFFAAMLASIVFIVGAIFFRRKASDI